MSFDGSDSRSDADIPSHDFMEVKDERDEFLDRLLMACIPRPCNCSPADVDGCLGWEKLRMLKPTRLFFVGNANSRLAPVGFEDFFFLYCVPPQSASIAHAVQELR